MDDAIEGHDVPYNDMADHNCPWSLWRNQSQAQWVSGGQGQWGGATARLTIGA